MLQAAKKTLEVRTDTERSGRRVSWSNCYYIYYYARFGMGEKALYWINNLNRVNAFNMNLMGSQGQVQDCNYGYPGAVAEMLLQSHTGEIKLLPALPEAWSEGEVSGLVARGGFEISMKWAGGHLSEASITSKQGNPCIVSYGGKKVALELGAGERHALSALVSKLATAPEPKIEQRIHKSNSDSLPYRILIPDAYDAHKKYPLVIALHGAWGKGTDNQSRAIDAFQKLAAPEVRKEYPAFLITPQCPEKSQWVDTPWGKGSYSLERVKISRPVEQVLEIIQAVQQEFSIDPSRIYVTGQSVGGYGTWDIIMRSPHLFAAAVPVCGAGDPSQVKNLKHLPIWCFHGGADTVVPVSAARDMDQAMKQVGSSNWRYTEYPGVGHGSSKSAWDEKELIPWIFKQKK